MRWENGVGFIDVAGGPTVPGGHSIELKEKGENKMHWYSG